MVWGRTGIGALLALPLAALAAAPASAASSANASAAVTVKVVKPLVLTSTGAMNFGTIIVDGLTAPRTISLSPENVMDCGGGTAELVCSGATSVPTYNVQGTNRNVVSIIKTPSTLTNASNGSTLLLTPSGPDSITLTNSGNPGFDFGIGGSITLAPSTGEGVYSGVVDVTVDYQ